MAKIPRSLLVLALGGVLTLPFLGSFGLWDPHEIREADVAQEVSRTGKYLDVTVEGKYNRRPVLTVWLVAMGFGLFGVNELAGRLPLAILGVLALLAGYRVTRKLAGERAALLGAFALATTPTFLFQSRQLVSEVGFYACIIASVGGLAAYLWPSDGRRDLLDLVLAGLGLVGGFLAKGLVIGTLFPVFCLGLAVAFSWRTTNAADENGAWPPADGPHLKPGTTVGEALLKGGLVPLLATVAAAGVVIGILLATMKDSSYMVLGAEYRKVAIPPTFETTFKELGWSFFPWFALVPMALALFVLAQRPDPKRRSRAAFPQMLIVVLAVGGYLLAAIWVGYFNKMRFPTLPWLALGVGVLVHQVWAQKAPVHRVWGVVAAGMVLVLQQDFYMYPESVAFSHVTEHAKYPIDLNIKFAVRLFGVLTAVLMYLALGGTPQQIQLGEGAEQPSSRRGVIGRLLRALAPVLRTLLRLAVRLLNLVGEGLRYIGGATNRGYHWATGALALAFALWCVFYLTPNLSLHMSNKALFQVFHRCKSGGEKLAQYQVPGRGAAYYNNGQVEQVGSQNQLFDLLRKPERWFILIPASYLAPVDQAARRSQVSYHVLDDRSSQYLLISNKLEGKCTEDHNPLRRYVLSAPPKPQKVLTANFENRVRLLGYDVPDVVTRGGKFRITLYFHVLGTMPSGYKLFIHFDQPANRFHGDHEPLDGKFPTQYWLKGDYIVDPHDVEIPLITTPSGTYTMYMGFWLGSQRLKVTDGPNDGVNRVRLGVLKVR